MATKHVILGAALGAATVVLLNKDLRTATFDGIKKAGTGIKNFFNPKKTETTDGNKTDATTDNNTNENVSAAVRDNYNGIARFWRAVFYLRMIQEYNDVPWIDHALDIDSRLFGVAIQDGRKILARNGIVRAEELAAAEQAEVHGFEDKMVFEGCMPVEVMAKRGYDTLCYGPLKPVGLVDPRTGAHSFAVVQLRRENAEGTMYNLVGFQTHLTFPEQKRVFRLIPGLENAEFLRYGVMHRNTFLHSPTLLDRDYNLRQQRNLYFAGQMTGVEGYIESTGSGFVAGLNAARRALGLETVIFPQITMIGAMAHYVSHGGIGDFVPMNANFGIVPLPEKKIRGGKVVRNEALAARSLAWIDDFVSGKTGSDTQEDNN